MSAQVVAGRLPVHSEPTTRSIPSSSSRARRQKMVRTGKPSLAVNSRLLVLTPISATADRVSSATRDSLCLMGKLCTTSR